MLTRILLLWGALLSVFAPAVARADVVDDASFAETSWHALDDRQITGMAWAPDGSNRLFITNKEGRVRIVKYGPPVMEIETPFATITPISTGSECGLIGIAFDPNFQVNHYVYFFVTVSSSAQQIIRYTAQGDVGTSKTVIVRDLPTDGANHDGGAVAIGPDGKLYWAIGDNGNGTGVDDDLTSLATKVGRANLDGSVPNDNPFFDGGDPNNDYIWARGLRNPFTMTFQPETGALWVNVVGDSYEQVFVVGRKDHAGYNDYENNQPAGYITPIIKYRTNGSDTLDLTASGAMRSGGVVTFTTDGPHRFRRGERITIAGVSNASFNGDVFVSSTPSATKFTAQQAGADATSGDGSATTQNLGGSITGGTFYTGTQFPEAYRGDFFFGDYNSDNVVRAALSAPSTVERVELWSTAIGGYIDAETGPDGALYYIEHGGEIHRVAYKASAQGLVVSNTNVWMSEGGQQSIGVSLAIAPAANVTVNVARASGDSGIGVAAGASLTFTPTNWNVPRAVTITSAVDADMANDVATLDVSASGITSQSVTVNAVEGGGGNALVVSTAALELDEGADATFMVELASEPDADVTVNVTRSSGDGDITVAGGATLTFTPANFDVAQTVTIAAAEDADNGNDSATIAVAASGFATRSITVAATDNDPAAPIITSSATTTAILNVQYRYAVTASGRPAPTFSLSAAPAGMTIGGSSGVITWTPSSSGAFPVAVVAANGVTPNAVQSFEVVVTADAPPTCSLTEPVVNQVVSGTTSEFFGDGHDDLGTVRAEFSVDGTVGYSDVGTSGHYHWRSGHALWDTTAYNDGSHQLKMKITDTAGQSCEVEIGVVIDNGMEPVADAGTSTDGGTSADAGITGPGQDAAPPVTPPQLQPPTVPGSSGRGGSGGNASSAGSGGTASSNPGAGSAAPHGNAAPEGDPDLTGGCSLQAGRSTSRRPLATLGLLALVFAARRRRRS